MRILSLLIITFCFAQSAFAEVHIASKLSYFSPKLEMRVKPLGISYQALTSKTAKTHELKISIQIKNAIFRDITAMVCSEFELQSLLAKRPYQCIGQKKFGNFDFIVKPLNNEIQYLVLKNANILLPKNVTAQILLTNEITGEQQQKFKQELEKLMQSIHHGFITPDFNLTVKGCGEKNAYSTIKEGNITICSEMLFEAVMRNKKGILVSVFAHELGHTLLNLWGLPNYDNERTADEFATVITLMSNEQKYIEEWLTFFEERQDSVNEALFIEEYKGLHPLNIQRITAIRQIMRNPLPVIKRWNKVLYPHMTNEALNDIVYNKQYSGSDAELAKSILESRNNEPNSQIPKNFEFTEIKLEHEICIIKINNKNIGYKTFSPVGYNISIDNKEMSFEESLNNKYLNESYDLEISDLKSQKSCGIECHEQDILLKITDKKDKSILQNNAKLVCNP